MYPFREWVGCFLSERLYKVLLSALKTWDEKAVLFGSKRIFEMQSRLGSRILPRVHRWKRSPARRLSAEEVEVGGRGWSRGQLPQIQIIWHKTHTAQIPRTALHTH